MSAYQWQWKWKLLFLFIFLQTLTPASQSITASPHPKFPCAPPYHNLYPFCNLSLPTASRAHSLLSLLTLPEKIHQLCSNASAVPRLGLPEYLWWSESVHGVAAEGPGVNFAGPIESATNFPQVLVAAAAFNRTLWRAIAAAIGVEARAMYNVGQAGLTFWAPDVNLFVDPRWGRGQETPGEDPMLAEAYGIEYVRAFQGGGGGGGEGRIGDGDGVGEKRVMMGEESENESDDGLMLSACCKHYTAYDLENWGSFARYNFNAIVTAQDLEDTYQPPFRSCIQQGKASCLMCSYNAVNGIPACADKILLQKARDEWGFKGYITSDCDAVATIYEYQHYTKSPEDAVAVALKAGTDINCGTYLLRHTQSAIDKGKVKEEDRDRALLNLFSVQIRLGLYDGDPLLGKFGKLGPQDVCTLEHKSLALEAVRQGIVLLKNEKKFLPLNKNRVSSLAIIGPMANRTDLGGGYTGVPCNPKNLLDAFPAYVKKTSYAAGCLDGVPCTSNAGFMEAVSIAEEADFVIVVAGLDLSQETEDHDRYSLLLPGYQMALVTTVAAVSQKPLVLVLTGGGPLDVSFAEGDPRIASILWIGYPGEAGGKALAEVIFGDYNPGGRLPVTWYPESFTRVSMYDMSMRADPSRGYPGRTYRFYVGDRIYGFGQGLSYTNYMYELLSAPNKLRLAGSLKIKPRKYLSQQTGYDTDYIHIDEVAYCDSLIFHVEVSVVNNGDWDGSHVVMLFSRVPNFFKGAPEKQLVGFDRVHTMSYKSTQTRIMVDPCKHLSIANENGKRIMPLGDHTLMVGDLEHILSIEGQ
ncbi:Beta-D-xylosidase [Actinidia chinensis var. chinensis]|uniref:Beta-D-xylosidase n=1 Tax=Actinidia chinensis var. chinensis TaxID=1590841 RepID=A0A2R6PA23_ACTCC|nr:Beta-D-xylosidase [Actinidia chinensis var. chinensis]